MVRPLLHQDNRKHSSSAARIGACNKNKYDGRPPMEGFMVQFWVAVFGMLVGTAISLVMYTSFHLLIWEFGDVPPGGDAGGLTPLGQDSSWLLYSTLSAGSRLGDVCYGLGCVSFALTLTKSGSSYLQTLLSSSRSRANRRAGTGKHRISSSWDSKSVFRAAVWFEGGFVAGDSIAGIVTELFVGGSVNLTAVILTLSADLLVCRTLISIFELCDDNDQDQATNESNRGGLQLSVSDISEGSRFISQDCV